VSTGTRTLSGTAIDAATAQGRAALIGYLPVGFPDLSGSVDAAKALVDGGVDVLELGLPYSDPLMDGPVIQHAVEAALRAGTRTRDVLAAVERVAARRPNGWPRAMPPGWSGSSWWRRRPPRCG
jgi:tryptophan synthase alpha chain